MRSKYSWSLCLRLALGLDYGSDRRTACLRRGIWPTALTGPIRSMVAIAGQHLVLVILKWELKISGLNLRWSQSRVRPLKIMWAVRYCGPWNLLTKGLLLQPLSYLGLLLLYFRSCPGQWCFDCLKRAVISPHIFRDQEALGTEDDRPIRSSVISRYKRALECTLKPWPSIQFSSPKPQPDHFWALGDYVQYFDIQVQPLHRCGTEVVAHRTALYGVYKVSSHAR